jgi:hypothetical protein
MPHVTPFWIDYLTAGDGHESPELCCRVSASNHSHRNGIRPLQFHLIAHSVFANAPVHDGRLRLPTVPALE